MSSGAPLFAEVRPKNAVLGLVRSLIFLFTALAQIIRTELEGPLSVLGLTFSSVRGRHDRCSADDVITIDLPLAAVLSLF